MRRLSQIGIDHLVFDAFFLKDSANSVDNYPAEVLEILGSQVVQDDCISVPVIYQHHRLSSVNCKNIRMPGEERIDVQMLF